MPRTELKFRELNEGALLYALLFVHPRRDALALALPEGDAEGAVAAVAALGGQFLGGEGTLGSVGLTDETDETVDAQVVDIGIVGGALTREIHAEVGAVGAKGLRQMRERQVVLQVELRALTLLLEQGTDLLIGGIGYGFGRRRLRDAQVGQRLHAPQQMTDEQEAAHLNDVFVGDAAVARHVIDEQEHDDRQYQQTLPHLLVLQVGIVVAQPAAVLSHLEHHIYHKADACQQEIALQPRQQRVTAGNHTPRHQDDERRHGRPHGPQRPAFVLQHAEHDDKGHGDGQQTVEQSADEHPQRSRIAIGHHGTRPVPHMAQGDDRQERCRPASEPQWRRDVGGKGVASPEQQVNTAQRRQHCDDGIKHHKYRIFLYLFVHIVCVCSLFAGVSGTRYMTQLSFITG